MTFYRGNPPLAVIPAVSRIYPWEPRERGINSLGLYRAGSDALFFCAPVISLCEFV